MAPASKCSTLSTLEKPKSPTAKEVVKPTPSNDEIKAIYEEKTPVKEETEVKPKEIIVPEVNEIESPSMPVNGDIIKPHSVNKPVYSKTLNDWRIHEGIDILCNIGDEVLASASGKVVDIYEDSALGYTVVIEHNGYATKYCNLSSVEGLSVGSKVKKGVKVGVVGDSAKFEISDDPHLHFEILKDGKSVDPFSYIK